MKLFFCAMESLLHNKHAVFVKITHNKSPFFDFYLGKSFTSKRPNKIYALKLRAPY